MTKLVLQKLKELFSLGCTDAEACQLAGISESTLYDFQKKNPRFSEEKRRCKNELIIKARRTIFDNLSNIKVAKWYAERKLPHEFNLRYISAPAKPTDGKMTPEHKRKVMAILEEEDLV